ncbi:hypothetical protein FJT64_017197 [Amphibalanus amphitrite]|uniref:Ig-like domain-containing protein n=1 Tax=Amphibalanus amphitrite TaxID=1232801 RepID=A0A6A4WWX4_AMPAM|nr:hypothetical protein FJT64_017197 [Amphibalanus amphitrite]
MLDMSRVPVKSKQPPPPRALKLPTISAAAMQALANRATMVSVDEVVFPHAPPVDGARGQPRYPPLSPAAYLRGVTAIATYRAYFFPGAAIQWLSYVLWLQVVLQDYEITAADVRTPLGQTVVLTCHVPAHVRAVVKVTSWAVDSSLNVYPTLFGGKTAGS